MKVKWITCLVIAGVVFLLFFSRLWKLNQPDLIPDELHYVTDGYRLHNHDPYMPLRHHPFRHFSPNMGHPLLVGAISDIIFDLFGASVYTSRLASALPGIAGGLLLFALTPELGVAVTTGAVLLYTLMPLTLRFQRDIHLDSVLTFFTTLAVICLWRYLRNPRIFWLAICGVSCGLAISSKLNGFIIFVLVLALYIYISIFVNHSKSFHFRRRQVVQGFIVLVLATISIAWLLNDGSAYLDGILHPSEDRAQLFSPAALKRLSTLPKYYRDTYYVFLPPLLLGTAVVGSVYLLRKRKPFLTFLTFWCIGTIPFVMLQQMGGAGPNGWQPLIVPLVLIVSATLAHFFKRFYTVALLLFAISMLPYTYWHGLGIKPWPNFQPTRILSDTYYQTVMNKLNEVAPREAEVYFWPHENFPMFALRNDMHWTYYGDIKTFDVLVVNKPLTSEDAKIFELVSTTTRDQDNLHLESYIYVKKK